MGLKIIFSKSASKIASKRIINIFQKIYFYRYYRCVLLFQERFFTDFAPYHGRPTENFKVLTCGNSSELAKGRTAIPVSSKL
jgi:restriction endonuclease S subunit